jgi:4-aminobutyrate aminotransferase / (S)-3-amino-2-methylpropionate transaminase / 5-aminovalerate transaminase
MGKVFEMTPREVPRVETRFRRIVTAIPHPESVLVLETLQRCEPVSMQGQPPIVWDRAEGVQVWDRYGNMWLDWSCGVLVTSAGHGIPPIREAIRDQVESGLLHNYCFPSEERAALVEYLVRLVPSVGDGAIEGRADAVKEQSALSRPVAPSPRRPVAPWKVFLLTTGAETTENALKLARSWGQRNGDRRKIGIVTFEHAFHGRTLGAQQLGGLAGQNDWIVHLDPDIHHVPFPDGFRTEETSFDLFLQTLKRRGVTPDRVAGVISETYQGVGPDFMPVEYARRLADWCREHDVLLIFDEVQAGFGRTGTLWGFEHYGVVPDVICCGKGISSSLPLAAVIGRAAVMDQFPPGSMTSTHTGNPVCCRAALANLQAIVEGGLIENARALEPVLMEGLHAIGARHARVVGCVRGRGLVAGLIIVQPGTKEPNPDLAHRIVEKAFQKGLLLFAPVGVGGGCVKIAPPLCITADAIRDGLTALGEAVNEAV